MGSAESRQCTVYITNNSTDYTLRSPSVHLLSGGCQTPLPAALRPSESGSVLFSKTALTARGSVGVFTYNLYNEPANQAEKKVAVMFSVPFDYNLYSNWYAVGVFDSTMQCDNNLFQNMYREGERAFTRGKAGHCLTYIDNQTVTIKATMTDTCQPTLTVDIE
ncbi:bryoporin-like isoform X2 [Archocentrus centrarchus]|nr:bryoporin-like isoform X2 [Archocentrus centrarchus]XP_030592518.1 bryoporin-like isoform X2 [Archocentrus centrarchus]